LDNPKKPLFLKKLANQLFSIPSGSTSFDVDNTLLIDDSSEKNMCNDPGNAIFLRTWSGQVDNNEFMGTIAPWLCRLYEECGSTKLWEYVKSNQIGYDPLTLNSRLHSHILDGMWESVGRMDTRFELPRMDYVIGCKSDRP